MRLVNRVGEMSGPRLAYRDFGLLQGVVAADMDLAPIVLDSRPVQPSTRVIGDSTHARLRPPPRPLAILLVGGGATCR